MLFFYKLWCLKLKFPLVSFFVSLVTFDIPSNSLTRSEACTSLSCNPLLLPKSPTDVVIWHVGEEKHDIVL